MSGGFMAAGRKGVAALVGAAVVFAAGAGWAATQVLGTPGSAGTTATSAATTDAADTTTDATGDAAATGAAFLHAWAARDFSGMQRLVADQNDDMARVYGGLARRLKLTKVAVRPGTLDSDRNLLPYTATLTVAGHPWTYRGAVRLTRTPDGWRVAFTSGTVYPGLQAGQTLTLTSQSMQRELLDRAGHDLSTDDDLEVNLLGEEGVSGLRRVVSDATASGPLQLVIQDVSNGGSVTVVHQWEPSRSSTGVRTTISLHQPHVLPCPSCASHDIPQAGAPRTLMRAVVTSGTGTATAGVGGGPVYGKTGTAEYGDGDPLPTHAWFVGWQGSTAFAVFAQNGATGGAVAAPAAARFLRAIG